MDHNDPLEARDARLDELQDTDPVAWAICWGYRSTATISKFLRLSLAEVDDELTRLVKAKEVKKVKFHRGYAHRPHSREMKRLARRAWARKQQNN